MGNTTITIRYRHRLVFFYVCRDLAAATCPSLQYRLDVNALHHDSRVAQFELNDIGWIHLYRDNRATSSLVLVDEQINTAAAEDMLRQPIG